jgi:hypothetical protein
MQAFKILMLTLALATATGAAHADPADGCTTKSVHGLWDCR